MNTNTLYRIAILLTTPKEYILIHRSAEVDTILVSSTDKIRPISGDYADVYLPNGDSLAVAKDLAAIKANEDMTNKELLEALHEYGIITMDSNGNYIF